MMGRSATTPLYELKGVRYFYEDKYPVLDGIDLLIMPGEQVVVLGANRSGKTTLLRLLAGLLQPTEGSLFHQGKAFNMQDRFDLVLFGRFLRKVGWVPEDAELHLDAVTVMAHLFHNQSSGFSKMKRHDVAAEVLEMLGLGNIGSRNPSTLSRGERKLVAIAKVLCRNPEILILDEPMSGLDSCVRQRLLELLTWLGKGGKTIILAEHDPELMEKFAGRIVILGEDHRVLADGPPDDVLKNYNLLAKASLLHNHLHRHGGKVHWHPHRHQNDPVEPEVVDISAHAQPEALESQGTTTL